jgi:glutamate synthase (NADPH/NADH) small chain
MANMSLKKNEMPAQDPKVRATNFQEVALGYTEAQALDEAARCLGCKNKPCVEDCPVNIDIPAFIARAKEGDFEGAYQDIAKYSSLPAICGRVCPQETQCEGKCIRGVKGEPVGIGRLERFVADWHLAREQGTGNRGAARMLSGLPGNRPVVSLTIKARTVPCPLPPAPSK